MPRERKVTNKKGRVWERLQYIGMISSIEKRTLGEIKLVKTRERGRR